LGLGPSKFGWYPVKILLLIYWSRTLNKSVYRHHSYTIGLQTWATLRVGHGPPAEYYALRNLGERLQYRLALLVLVFFTFNLNQFLSLKIVKILQLLGVTPLDPLKFILYYGHTEL